MLTGCASSMNVSSYVEHVLDVSRYRTYDWGPADALPTGDPRLDRNSFFRDHMEGAVEKQLAARGMERSAPGKADLLIHYHASIDRRLNVNAADRQYGYCSADDCPAYVSEYEEGTLVLDVVDTRTNRVVWRGWAQDHVEPMLNNPDTMERKINEGVTRMMERFPVARRPSSSSSSVDVATRAGQ
jgi:hypothetical protein